MASSLAVPKSYTNLTTFTSMGQPDVILRLQDGGDLFAHSHVLKAFSKVFLDVTGSTLPPNLADSEDVIVPSVIPLGGGDSPRVWSQALSAIYSFTNGATDDVTWKDVLVSVGVPNLGSCSIFVSHNVILPLTLEFAL